MISNKARVGRALYLLKIDLDTFVPREFSNHHQDESSTVLNQILGQSRDPQKPFQNMKTQDLLTVVQSSWWDVFDRVLGGIEPSVIREIAMSHEVWTSRQDFSPDFAYQALSSIQRMLSAMSSPSTLELDMLKRESLESEEESDQGTESESQVPDSPANSEASSPESEAAAEDEAASVEEPVEAEKTAQPDSEDEPYLLDLIQALREAGALQSQDFFSRATRDGTPPQYVADSFIQELNPALVQALKETGIDRLFAHQGEAVSQSLAGANVALDAGWAADETLTWAIPLAETLLRNPGSHALVLCPERETAEATSTRLERLLAAVGLHVVSCLDESASIETGLGDSGAGTALVTTTDHLNRSLTGQGESWQTFLNDLKFIAVNQAQEFRGHFGSNAAILLRRLAHRLAILGASCQNFVITHGCANAAELAETLTGKVFQPISCLDGASPRRHYIFIDPRESDPSPETGLPDRAGRAALACAQGGKSVLVCCPDENLARQCFAAAQQLVEAHDADAGLLSLRLEEGPISTDSGEQPSSSGQAVFTTVCLATESTPGDFDGIILAGYPGSPRSAVRLMDAAGTRVDEAFAILLAAGDSGSRFAAHNLDSFLAKAPDQIVMDADMAEIIQPHLPALVHESGGRAYSFSREVLGNAVFQALRRAATELPEEEESPLPEVSLRPPGDQDWSLWYEGEQVASLAPYRKFREVYPGSVIDLNGDKFRSGQAEPDNEDGGARQIVLEASDALANLRTVPQFEAAVSIQHESLCLSPAAGVSLHLGMVGAEEKLVQVSVIDESQLDGSPGDVSQSADGLDLVTAVFTPEQEISWSMNSPAFWTSVEGLLAKGRETEAESRDAAALKAVAQMLQVGAQFIFPVERYDLAAYSDTSNIFLVEVSPQAQGIAKRAFDLWRDVLECGASLARRCPCTGGCSYCLLPHSFYGQELDKARGLALANRLLEITGGS